MRQTQGQEQAATLFCPSWHHQIIHNYLLHGILCDWHVRCGTFMEHSSAECVTCHLCEKDWTPPLLITSAELIGLCHSSCNHLSTGWPWRMEMNDSDASLPQTVPGKAFSYWSRCGWVHSGYWQNRMWNERRGRDTHLSYSLRSRLPQHIYEHVWKDVWHIFINLWWNKSVQHRACMAMSSLISSYVTALQFQHHLICV